MFHSFLILIFKSSVYVYNKMSVNTLLDNIMYNFTLRLNLCTVLSIGMITNDVGSRYLFLLLLFYIL